MRNPSTIISGLGSVLFWSLLVHFFIPSPGIGAEDDTLSSLMRRYQDYHDDNYREIIYIQTDKNFYLAGDFIRFSIFCLEAGTKRYSQLSKIAYLELIDTNQTAIMQIKVRLEEGRGHGEVFLPSNFESGNYLLRSYTRWMQNYGPGEFYRSIVQIINPYKKPFLLPAKKQQEVSIKFFPEGGTLVAGLPARIGFRAINSYGEGVDFSGSIMDDMDNEILNFSPVFKGLGSFKFIPEQGRSYQAVMMLQDSTTLTRDLPDYLMSGSVLSIDNRDPGFLLAEVYSNAPSSNTSFFLLGTSNESMLFGEEINMQNGKGSVRIPKDDLIPGQLTVTLFNFDGQPVCERLVYIPPKSDTQMKIETDKTVYGNREKVTLTIQVSDEQDRPLPSSLSVSIFSYNDQFDRFQQDIRDCLLFNGQVNLKDLTHGLLSGDQADSMTQVLDDLMITMQRQSVIWYDQENGYRQKEHVPEYRDHLITGTVTDVRSGEPAEGIFAFLSVPSKNASFHVSRSDEKGRLYFQMNDFNENNDIVVSTNYANDSVYHITIDDPFSTDHGQTHIPSFNIVPDMRSFLEQSSRNMQIQNSYRSYRPSSITVSDTDSLSFYKPDEKYFLDDYTRFPVMEEVFREYITGVYLRRNRAGYYLRILDVNRNETYQEDPLILLDGVPVFDADEIIALNPLYVERIETVRQRFVKGLLNCNGIVSLITYDGDLKGYTLNRHTQRMSYDGVQPSMEYITPAYGTREESNQRMPDFRNVLYWDPEFHTDGEGRAVLEFYTSDDVSTYRVIIEGLTSDGRPISGQSFLEVKSE